VRLGSGEMKYYVEIFTSTGKKQNERIVTRRSCQSLKAVNDALAGLWSGAKCTAEQLEKLPVELTEGLGTGSAYRGVRVRK
jgi:hypothetical protein